MASIGNIILLFGLAAFVNTSQLCVLENQSCSKQFFPNDTDKICDIIYYKKDSENCQLMDFMTSQENRDSFDYPPWLTIHTYNFRRIRTGFNITVLGEQWNHLKLRYQRNVHKKTNDNSNHCREFYISPKGGRIPFIYDCNWTNLESETYILEVQVDSDHDGSRLGKYIFDIPKSSTIGPDVEIEKLTVFIYIEVTDLETPIVHIQLADPRLEITRYIVTTYKIDNQNEIVSIRNVSSTIATNNVLRFPVNDVEGEFRIGVVPINSLGQKGPESFSPVVPRAKPPLSTLTLCMVTTGALLPAFVMGIFMWRYVRKRELERRNKIENEKYDDYKKIHFEFSNQRKIVDNDLINYNLGDNMSPIEVEKRLMDTKGLVCN